MSSEGHSLWLAGGSFPYARVLVSGHPTDASRWTPCKPSEILVYAALPSVLCPAYSPLLDLFGCFSVQGWAPPGHMLPHPHAGQYLGAALELISVVSYPSRSIVLHFLMSASLLKLLFYIFCLWFCVFVFFSSCFFQLFQARSKSGPCHSLLARSRGLILS